MPWTTALADLRVQLSDGPTDRYHFRKKCFGEVNGVNKRFKTFEFRRVTNFTATQGVYLNGVLQPILKIASDSVSTGEFILTSAPSASSEGLVEASYFTQWFLDSELVSLLQIASLWTVSTSDYTNVPGGLIPAALKYACAEGYLKMATRWRTYDSSVYKVEDAPRDEVSAKVDDFTKMAEAFREEALKARTEYYQNRQGRALQPLSGSILGNIQNMP